MPEPFEIIDPLERFAEAREELVSDGIRTARQGRQTRPNQALWLAVAAIFAISTLILVMTLRPRVPGEVASIVNNQAAFEMAAQRDISSRQLQSDPAALPAVPPQTQSVHAIDPEASVAPSSESQVQVTQKSRPPSDVTSGEQAPALESSPSVQVKDQSPSTGDQLLRITSAVSIRNGPSASADVIGTAYAGAKVRVASRDSGWTEIVDPSSGRTGWIDSTVLSPPTSTVDTASIEDSKPKQMSEDETAGALNTAPPERGFETPAESALSAIIESKPVVKAKKHVSNRHYHRRRFAFRFGLRFFRR